MAGDVHVLSTNIGKSTTRPDDNGKRWAAWCSSCSWQRQFVWKGGHKLATRAAVSHVCSAAVSPSCAGCGGALEVEPRPVENLPKIESSRSSTARTRPATTPSTAPWGGRVLVLLVAEGLGFVHDHPECVAVARC
jgi:hypothetical protein